VTYHRLMRGVTGAGLDPWAQRLGWAKLEAAQLSHVEAILLPPQEWFLRQVWCRLGWHHIPFTAKHCHSVTRAAASNKEAICSSGSRCCHHPSESFVTGWFLTPGGAGLGPAMLPRSLQSQFDTGWPRHAIALPPPVPPAQPRPQGCPSQMLF